MNPEQRDGDCKVSSWRWMDLRSGSGHEEPDAEHMSVDAALLDDVARAVEPATIRCYTWSLPCITFGRLQDESAVAATYPSTMRYQRPTGGRAVFHGDDLTISVCAPHPFVDAWGRPRYATKRVHATYLELVAPVREALATFGIHTCMGSERSSLNDQAPVGEDCFAVSAACDLVDARSMKKILGSAMRRTSAAVLLQMSLKPINGIDIAGDLFVSELRERYQTR